MVHDLSFPPRQSVNDGIARDEYFSQPFHLRLLDVDRLVEFINRKGPGCLIFKKDLKHAYRQIPVDPNDYHLLGMCIDGQFYFHTVMQFGLRLATLACQLTTKAVSYILNDKGILVDVYIDDFYRTETRELAEHSFDVFRARVAFIAQQRHSANTRNDLLRSLCQHFKHDINCSRLPPGRTPGSPLFVVK